MYVLFVPIYILYLLFDGLDNHIQLKTLKMWILNIFKVPTNILYYIYIYTITVRRYRIFTFAAVVIGYGVIILRDAADATDDRFTQSRRKK